MIADGFDWSAYVDAAAAVHRLPLDDERRAAVTQQLRQIETLARRLMDFPLQPEAEPAPVFRP